MSRTNHRRPAKTMRGAIAAMCTHNSSANRSDRYARGRLHKPAERAALADMRDELHHEAHIWQLVTWFHRELHRGVMRALLGARS